MFTLLLIRCSAAFLGIAAFAQSTAPLLGKNSIPKAIKAMTVEKKVQLVVGPGFNLPGATGSGTGVSQTQNRVAGAAGTTYAISRLGIRRWLLLMARLVFGLILCEKEIPEKHVTLLPGRLQLCLYQPGVQNW